MRYRSEEATGSRAEAMGGHSGGHLVVVAPIVGDGSVCACARVRAAAAAHLRPKDESA